MEQRTSTAASQLPESITFKSLDEYAEYISKSRKEFDQIWKHQRFPTGSFDEWERLRTLGSGSFGRVILVRNKTSGQYCVMKAIEKAKVVKHKQVDHLATERRVLNYVRFPFLLSLISSFKNFDYVFFVLPFISGGEMFTYLRRVGKFSEEQSRFYAAQVVLSFEYLHNVDLIYRDLKPENILIDHVGYLKIADMGFCKLVKSRTYTFCGTSEYLAPEIVLNRGYGKSVDWWAVGVLIYEMAAGYPPFYGGDSIKTYDKITSGKYREVSHFTEHLRDLIKNLLQVDLSRRFGILRDGVNDIKRHNWFRSTNWLAILNKQVKAPYIPRSGDPSDACNFDRCEEEALKESSTEKFPTEFKDF